MRILSLAKTAVKGNSGIRFVISVKNLYAADSVSIPKGFWRICQQIRSIEFFFDRYYKNGFQSPFRLTTVHEIARISISSVVRYRSGKMVQMFLPHAVQLRLLVEYDDRPQMYGIHASAFFCAKGKYLVFSFHTKASGGMRALGVYAWMQVYLIAVQYASVAPKYVNLLFTEGLVQRCGLGIIG